MSTTHPAFEKAPPDRRWKSGSLKDLWKQLNADAGEDPGAWVGRVLPGGAYVCLRMLEGNRREVLIYRREEFRTDEAPTRWTSEILTFARHFGILGWTREVEHDRPRARFIEQERQETLI